MRDSKKKSRIARIAACAAIAGVMAASLAACAAGTEKKIDTSTPTGTVEAALEALKTKDVTAFSQLYGGDAKGFSDMPAAIMEYGLDENTESAKPAAQSLVDKLLDFDYKVESEKVEENFATVDVDFKTFDVGSMVTDVLDTSYGKTLDEVIKNGASESDQAKKVADTIAEKVAGLTEKTKESKGTVTLTKTDGKWLVDDMTGDFDFMNAITGGAPKAMEEWSEKLIGDKATASKESEPPKQADASSAAAEKASGASAGAAGEAPEEAGEGPENGNSE